MNYDLNGTCDIHRDSYKERRIEIFIRYKGKKGTEDLSGFTVSLHCKAADTGTGN